jgi:hypothetical protein
MLFVKDFPVRTPKWQLGKMVSGVAEFPACAVPRSLTVVSTKKPKSQAAARGVWIFIALLTPGRMHIAAFFFLAVQLLNGQNNGPAYRRFR